MPVSRTASIVTLSHPKGASVEVYLYGATVTSWKSPAKGTDSPVKERLFVSSLSALDGSKPIRGGIPIAFPFFGPPTKEEHKSMSQHGFARSSVWTFDSVVMDNEAGVSVRLTLEPNDAIRSAFPQEFHLALVITLAAHELSTDLHVENKSSQPLTYQALFHTYFACDASQVKVSSLKGLTYLDKTRNYAEVVEERDELDVKNYTDAVYKSAPGNYTIKYPGGGVHIRTKGFNDVVVWNPHAEAGRALADMEDGGWDKYICVEPGMATYWHELAPGSRWIGQQVLEAL